MKHILIFLFTFVSFATATPLMFEGAESPGMGEKIVLMAEDHEHRSEESLPQLAPILANHQGCKCTALCDIDPDGNIAAGMPQHD
ncbi:MAG: hypothetical protein ACKVY0_12575 [Prosthecobacter sp.]|uniref:hypothetical protein n=1 Tax=Prosthecobacter sp. TaxID=1965333 RepID=UPI0038FFAAC8